MDFLVHGSVIVLISVLFFRFFNRELKNIICVCARVCHDAHVEDNFVESGLFLPSLCEFSGSNSDHQA